ncbi:hypothetical protein EQO05_03425 [Methanosarcina sp. MSH10X1]|nr:hypothetical protein EQO05_03425 [Methanosarcina sp. MSH10X1]
MAAFCSEIQLFPAAQRVKSSVLPGGDGAEPSILKSTFLAPENRNGMEFYAMEILFENTAISLN